MARRRQTRLLVIGTVVLPVFMMVAEAVGLLLARRDHSDRPHNLLLVVILLALPMVLILVELGVFLLLRRRGVGWMQPSPVMGTDRPRRKRIVRALRRGEHLDGTTSNSLSTPRADGSSWRKSNSGSASRS